MNRANLTELTAFSAVATLRSFRKAADALALSPSTVSHLMRALEQRMRVRLLHRTTRSVAPTEAGERLLARLRPALDDLQVALQEVDDLRERPMGRLRINATEYAIRALLRDVVPVFRERFPDIELDLVSEGKQIDIVKEGFDAGVRLGGMIPQDMVSVGFSADERCLVVASRKYLAKHAGPKTPDDLRGHECIRLRLPSGKLFHWEFERRGQEVSIDVPGGLTLGHEGLTVEAALDGLGLAYVFEGSVRAALKAGNLVAVLEDWCPPFPGMFLYYPGHRHVPPPLRAFIDTLKMSRIAPNGEPPRGTSARPQSGRTEGRPKRGERRR
jgi:DNA-binding transcriptional LysR family regulator